MLKFLKRQSSDSKPAKQEEVNMKSVELLFSITQNEYSNEHERTTMIQSKAGIALPIVAGYFLTLAKMNDYKSILQIPVSSVWTSLLPLGLFFSYSLGLLFAIIALVYMARVVFVKGYKRIHPKKFCKEESLTQEYQVFVRNLMHTYFDAIDFNAKANDDRMKMYKQSWTYTLISVLCFLVYVLLKNNS